MIYFQPVGPESTLRELMLYEGSDKPSIHRDGYSPSHTSLLAAFCLQVDVDEARAFSRALHARITGSQTASTTKHPSYEDSFAYSRRRMRAKTAHIFLT